MADEYGDDQRYEFGCRMRMLAAAVLHWVATGIVIWDRLALPETSDYTTRAVAHVASALPAVISWVAQ